MNTTDQKSLARHLYMTQGKTQKQIAEEVGVSERTVFSWIHQLAWDKIKLAACQAPVSIAENLCSQLIELQNTIAQREPGLRFPTPQEAETTRKLITCLEKMKKYPSLSQNMQMLETFKNYIRPVDDEFARKLGNYSERFLSAKTVNGFAPYEIEYGLGNTTPVMPLYDEPISDEPPTPQEPAPVINRRQQFLNYAAEHDTLMEYMNVLTSLQAEESGSDPATVITHEERKHLLLKYAKEHGTPAGYARAKQLLQAEETGSDPATATQPAPVTTSPAKASPTQASTTPATPFPPPFSSLSPGQISRTEIFRHRSATLTEQDTQHFKRILGDPKYLPS